MSGESFLDGCHGATTTIKKKKTLSEGYQWQTFRPNRIQGISRITGSSPEESRSHFHQSESKTNVDLTGCWEPFKTPNMKHDT